MVWALGQRLQDGHYTIEKELGEGGFGITYLAREKDGRQVVIKTVNDKVQRRPDSAKFQQDFLNEALRLAKCSHPHIVRIEEVIQEGVLWGMVMEYIDGEDLAHRVENRGALPEAEALRYIHQIGEALIVVHNQSLLHRDIKPQNIMLRSGKSEAVLIDFGISREFAPNLTQTHTQMLSDGFAPIEQYDKRAKRGAYTDIYALAATLYSLLTGEVPIHAPLRAYGMLLEEPKQIKPSISGRVNQAILKGMEVNAANRPQSVQEWLALLGTKFTSAAPLASQAASALPLKPPPYYQSPPQSPSVPLLSIEGLDYSKLRDLLASRKWNEANEETANKICTHGGDINYFPCEDLRTIDQLWVRYSNGRFGFSVQNRIWQRVDRNWDKFGHCVGWRYRSDWRFYSDLIFTLYAPIGHLPSPLIGYRYIGGIKFAKKWNDGFKIGLRKEQEWVCSIASALIRCNISSYGSLQGFG